MKSSGVWVLILRLSLAAALNADPKDQFGLIPVNREDDHKYSHQTIVIMEEDAAVVESAAYLFKRHQSTSTLLTYNKGALRVLRGSPVFPSPYGELVLVGHGSRTTTGALRFAGYGPEELARFVSTLKAEFAAGHVAAGHVDAVSLVSCDLGGDRPFVRKLLQNLRPFGAEPTLHLHDALLSVNSDGEVLTGRNGVWRAHDHGSRVLAELNPTGDLVTRKILGCAGPVIPNYEGSVLYLQTLEWPRHPQMFVPMELRKKYPFIDCLEGLTWSLFFEESDKRRAPDYIRDSDGLKAVWLQEQEVTQADTVVLKHITNIQDLLVEIRYNAREDIPSDLFYVLNECIYKVHGKNLSVSLMGKFMRADSEAEMEHFRQAFGDQQGEASLQELRQELKASKFNDFCRQTFQFQQCTYNCERWGRYFMSAVFAASIRNFRTFSLFLMSVIGCEVGRSRGTDSPLCTAFVGDEHPMVTDQPWPEHLKRGFYGCTVDDYQMAPQHRQTWLDQVVAKENALYVKSKRMMDAFNHNDQTELEIFGKIKVMNKYVFSSYLEYFRGTPEGKKLKRGCTPSYHDN
ncbi:uncharacterized protein LOC119617006 [Kryptolebias marmoratus]|uniref:uncharacterized protein LOC119617006 n=1 Tax=Kryptolebias marmoratus TaxID=37003 RepID=UPI0018AC9720|nr:uncharacterized protein LOC119617006 [Kryptolebias marmoratus]